MSAENQSFVDKLNLKKRPDGGLRYRYHTILAAGIMAVTASIYGVLGSDSEAKASNACPSDSKSFSEMMDKMGLNAPCPESSSTTSQEGPIQLAMAETGVTEKDIAAGNVEIQFTPEFLASLAKARSELNDFIQGIGDREAHISESPVIRKLSANLKPLEKCEALAEGFNEGEDLIHLADIKKVCGKNVKLMLKNPAQFASLYQ